MYMQEMPLFRKRIGLSVVPGCARHTELALGCISGDTQQFLFILGK